MPVPFRDDEEIDNLGLAAYLKIEPDESGYRGSLFLVNARAEPVEFAYTRVEIPQTFLWRRADIRLHATRKIAASLFSSCSRTPNLIFCLAEEVESEVFVHDLSVTIPVCRISSDTAVCDERFEHPEEADSTGAKQLFWFPSPPAEGSSERKLFRKLSSWALIAEPFERASVGLREVYK